MSTDFYLNTISKEMSIILGKVMNEPLFKNFTLVGGTALSLQMGHKKSIDLDLFSNIKFDFELVQNQTNQYFPYSDKILKKAKNYKNKGLSM